MAAVPIYVWNGTAWQETGPTIPANPIKYQASAPSSPSTGDIWVDSDGDVTTGSQQFQRFRFVASGGETTISGADANGAVLAYTAGMEQVVLNGAVLVRGHDYTATNGTTITGLSPALVANDVLEVFSFIAFTVANTYTQSQADGLFQTKTTNGLVLLNTTSFSGVASYSLPANTFNATYTNYRILITSLYASAGGINVIFRLRKSGTDNSDANSYRRTGFTSVSGSLTNSTGTDSSFYMTTLNGSSSAPAMMDTILYSPFVNNQTQINRITYRSDDEAMNMGVGRHTTADTFDSASFITSSGTMTGIISVYGFNI